MSTSTMNSNVAKRWIEAGKVLAVDATAIVSCPVCGQSHLHVEDVRGKEDSSVIERIMRCPSCGAMNTLRLVRLAL